MDPPFLNGLSPVLRLPKDRRYLVIPTRDKRAFRTGLTLMTACSPRAILAQALAGRAVAAVGTWIVPGRRESWQPPCDTRTWSQLLQAWQDMLGPYDDLAVYVRPQASRSGIAVVPMLAGRPLALVKVRGDEQEFDHESAVLAALDGRAGGLRVPRVVAVGDTPSGWAWMALEYVADGQHRPATLTDPRSLDDELAGKLSSVLPRDGATPSHWRPMHGDLTPWNLRRDRHAAFLIDWEDASWAPPRADEVYFAATAHAALVGPAPIWSAADDESRQYWRRLIGARAGSDEDAAGNVRLLEILGQA